MSSAATPPARPPAGSILGHAVPRREDPAILTGEARYLDDLAVDGCLHAHFVRSTVAHGRLDGIDTTGATAAPGVVGAYTAGDLDLEPILGFMMLPPTLARPPLARDRVRFVGEALAVVVAEARAQAVDAAEAVIADIEPLPVVVDPEAALAEGAPVIIEAHGSNVAMTFDSPEDPELFADAEMVVRGRFENQRLAAVPMEPNGIVAVPDGDGLHCWVPTQAPHGVRDGIAVALGLPAERVRVTAPTVGGGFGAKAGMYPEYAVVAALARRLGRPVRWAETRSENMVAMTHGRGQVQYVELGLRRDGTITALRARVVQDAGAYPSIGAFLPYLTRLMGQGTYRIPKVEVRSVSAITNTTATAAYRGAGRPEATAMLERIVDLAATELGVDPVELRRHNLIPPEDFPLTTVTGAHYDTGDYAKALAEACRRANYDELRAEQARRRAAAAAWQLGIGVSCYVEITAGGLFSEFGGLEVHPDGSATVTVGTSAHGQGHETAFAMIVAELLGIPMEHVRVVQSDTALVPHGTGTMGSRSLQIGGSAVHRAAEVVLEKARALTAHLLEARPEDVTFTEPGRLGVAGVPARALGWSDLAAAAADPARLPEGMEPGLAHAGDWSQGEATFPFGAHVAVVEVDTETGRVRHLRHVAVDDCGRVLNPLLVAGQQHGGIAQGAAQVLWEGYLYDSDGNPLTATLMDYAVPSAAELPAFEVSNTETPTPLNPLGAKGIGESGTIGSTPALHNAVIDAVAHLGVRHIDMPCTPERVWRAIQDARAAAAS